VTGLTIAVCTRDRPADLERCVRSIVAAESPEDVKLTVLIIDDGDLPRALIRELERMVRALGHAFTHVRQRGPHGLIHGRVTAVERAADDVILFLDDDVEIEPAYLRRLTRCYLDHPEAAGVGGVDTLAGTLPPLKALFARVFLLDSGDSRKLSSSGFSWSMYRWGREQGIFRTEVLSGCNMSFRRFALQTLTAVPWLQGYSLGEDAYLSLVAAGHGPLWVDPTLRVRHHRSVTSRMAGDALAHVTIVSAYQLLRARSAGWWNYAALLWTILGLVLKDAIRPNHWGNLAGDVRGVRDVIDDLSTAYRSDHIDAKQHR
jgi:glycosyltransferase involved in cell wall biosynthesis